MDIHVYLESGTADANRLAHLTTAITHLIERIHVMAQDLSALKSAVAANTNTINSAVVLIQGLSAKLQEAIDAGADPGELQAIVDELNTKKDELAAAVVANTPAAVGEAGELSASTGENAEDQKG